LNHPNVTQQVTSRQFAGRLVSAAHQICSGCKLMFIHPEKLEECDVLFVGLPNGASMDLMPNLMKKAKKIIDLGADFRLRSTDVFEDWSQQKHTQPQSLKKFVYGIAELHREEIAKSNYISCGGCEATVSILSLYPLVKHGLIENKIIIDAKMSSSQAGLSPTLSSHHPERSGVVRSYMPSGHRHTAEILQELSNLSSGSFAKAQDDASNHLDIAISATALDMVRGLLVTIHTVPKKGITEKIFESISSRIWRRTIYSNRKGGLFSGPKIYKNKLLRYRF
jgi:N-acetyl-gamma-glutamyl-phosphate/LysW-gamma-L-alpha-aminoadipyl-6-phosphate reductase